MTTVMIFASTTPRRMAPANSHNRRSFLARRKLAIIPAPLFLLFRRDLTSKREAVCHTHSQHMPTEIPDVCTP